MSSCKVGASSFIVSSGSRTTGSGRVTHVADFVFRQHVSVDVGTAVAHVRRIGGGDHGVNAGNLFSFAGVDTHDLRVSVLASQDAAVELVFQGQVDAVNAGADDALDAAP